MTMKIIIKIIIIVTVIIIIIIITLSNNNITNNYDYIISAPHIFTIPYHATPYHSRYCNHTIYAIKNNLLHACYHILSNMFVQFY